MAQPAGVWAPEELYCLDCYSNQNLIVTKIYSFTSMSFQNTAQEDPKDLLKVSLSIWQLARTKTHSIGGFRSLPLLASTTLSKVLLFPWVPSLPQPLDHKARDDQVGAVLHVLLSIAFTSK